MGEKTRFGFIDWVDGVNRPLLKVSKAGHKIIMQVTYERSGGNEISWHDGFANFEEPSRRVLVKYLKMLKRQ